MRWSWFLFLGTLSLPAYGIPGADTALLIEMVSNTASTASNTLSLLKATKEAADKVDEYNNVMMRHYNLARRLQRTTEEVALISHMDQHSWGQFNREMRTLKYDLMSYQEEQEAYNEWLQRQFQKSNHERKKDDAQKDSVEATQLANTAPTGGAIDDKIHEIAMSTSLANKNLVKLRQNQLDELELHRQHIQTQEAREMLTKDKTQEWIGLSTFEGKL
jgi:hypothetical protein